MTVLDETGKPAATVPQADGDGGGPENPAERPGPKDAVAQIVVTLRGDGSIGVNGTPDMRLNLRMLHEAVDILVVNLAQAQVFSRLSRPQIEKPSLRDVLATAKH